MSGPVLFGVRHLSPAAAFQLRRALDAARPALVLVEGPSDLNDQIMALPPQNPFSRRYSGLYQGTAGAHPPVPLRRLLPGNPGHSVGR